MFGLSNLETAPRYIASLASGASPEGLEEFVGRDFVQEEFPKQVLTPRGDP